MKQVWQCDHCEETGIYGTINEHEQRGCRFDPKTKVCETCTFYKPIPYNFEYECKKHDIKHMIDVESRKVKCESYKEDI